jgi:hypothetical protein
MVNATLGCWSAVIAVERNCIDRAHDFGSAALGADHFDAGSSFVQEHEASRIHVAPPSPLVAVLGNIPPVLLRDSQVLFCTQALAVQPPMTSRGRRRNDPIRRNSEQLFSSGFCEWD